jgi:hypothetical protein
MRRCERWEDEEKMSRWGEDEKMRRWEDEKMWGWEDVKMRRCEDEKMFCRPPLLEEPCAQTLSGKKLWLGPKNMYRSKKKVPRSKNHASLDTPPWKSVAPCQGYPSLDCKQVSWANSPLPLEPATWSPNNSPTVFYIIAHMWHKTFMYNYTRMLPNQKYTVDMLVTDS